MAVGFPAKTTFANGNTLGASDLNDFGGTLNLLSPVGKNAGALLTADGSSGVQYGVAPTEPWNIVASAATGTINMDVATSAIWYYTSNASANWTLNIRWNSTTTLASKLAVGGSATVIFANTNGTTAYYPSAIQIDGNAVTPKWSGGTAITAGNASAIDVYTLTIVKTAATPTYLVLAAQTKMA